MLKAKFGLREPFLRLQSTVRRVIAESLNYNTARISILLLSLDKYITPRSESIRQRRPSQDLLALEPHPR